MSTVDNKALKGVVPMASQPQEIAPGVYCLEVGKGIMRSNVYFVRSGSSWVLIDSLSSGKRAVACASKADGCQSKGE